MSSQSQLNPNAAVFIPVTPADLLMMDEAIITVSPGMEYEETTVNTEYSSPKHVDYFMRDNFSTLRNKTNQFDILSACSELKNRASDDSTSINSQEHMELISFDKLLAVQNITEKDVTGELGKVSFFGTTNISIDNESGEKITSRKGNTITTGSVEKIAGEHNVVSETTVSSTMVVPEHSTPEDILPIYNETELELPACDLSADTQICPDTTSPRDGPKKELTPHKNKSKSSRSKHKKKSKKVNVSVDGNPKEFTVELRRSPPLELAFKPIQNFRDTNAFDALKEPSACIPKDTSYNLAECKTSQEIPKKEEESCTPEINQLNTMRTTTPPSFILSRSPVDEVIVPFEDLESPNELPHFVHPPSANNSMLTTELPESPEILSVRNQEHTEPQTNAEPKVGFNEVIQDLLVDDMNTETQEISCITQNSQTSKTLPNFNLDTNERFLRPKYKIREQQNKCEKPPKLDAYLNLNSLTTHQEESNICGTEISKAVENFIPAFDDEENETCWFGTLLSSIDSETAEYETEDCKVNFNQSGEDLFADNTNPEMEETSFTKENIPVKTSLSDNNFGSKEELLETEFGIMQCNEDLEQGFKLYEAQKPDIEHQQHENNVISDNHILKGENELPIKFDNSDSNIKAETKLMELELEPQMSTSQTTPEELRNLVQGFEVINKDELIQELNQTKESKEVVEPLEISLKIGDKKEEAVNLNKPLNGTSLLEMSNVFTADGSASPSQTGSADDDDVSNIQFLHAIDKHIEDSGETPDAPEQNPSSQAPPSLMYSEKDIPVPPPLPSVSFFCQTPILSKDQKLTENTDSCSTGKQQDSSDLQEVVVGATKSIQIPVMVEKKQRFVEKEATSAPIDERSPFDSEPVQSIPIISMMATEVLTHSLEVSTKVPLVERSEEPVISRTVPTTLFPLPEVSPEVSRQLFDLPERDILKPDTVVEIEMSDVVAQKEVKKEDEQVKVKKSVDEATKRPSDITAKQSAKPATIPAPKATSAKSTTSVVKPGSGAKTTTSGIAPGKTVTVKPATSSMNSTKVSTSGSVSAKPTTSSVATSKPASSKLGTSSVPTKPAGSSVTPSKSTASTVGNSKPSVSTVTSSKTSTTNSKPAASGTTFLKSTASTTPSKSVTSGVTTSKTASTSFLYKLIQESSKNTSSSTPYKPVATSVTTSKAAAVTPTKSVTSSIASVRAVDSNTASVKSAANTTAAKPIATSTSVKKPADPSLGKPTGSKTTSSVTKPTVTNTVSSKSVPELHPVNETTPAVSKSSTSAPTTPTMPKASMMKSAITKSPSKPETKSPLPVKPIVTPKPFQDTSSDKPSNNSGNKVLSKKAEVPKNLSTVTVKPVTPTKATTSGAKLAGSTTKSPTSIANKATVPKPTAALATKPKPGEALDETSNLSPTVGPKNSTITTVTKTADKTGKESTSGKSTVSGKTATGKTTLNVKTDPRGNKKNSDKSPSSKKPEEGKKEEKSVQLQEHKVSTTDEFSNNTNDHQSQLIHVVAESEN